MNNTEQVEQTDQENLKSAFSPKKKKKWYIYGIIIVISIIILGYLSNLVTKNRIHRYMGEEFSKRAKKLHDLVYHPPDDWIYLRKGYKYTQSKKLFESVGVNIAQAKTKDSFPFYYISDPDWSIPFCVIIDYGFYDGNGVGAGRTYLYFAFFGLYFYIDEIDGYSI